MITLTMIVFGLTAVDITIMLRVSQTNKTVKQICEDIAYAGLGFCACFLLSLLIK